jgi:hypothetical protein
MHLIQIAPINSNPKAIGSSVYHNNMKIPDRNLGKEKDIYKISKKTIKRYK